MLSALLRACFALIPWEVAEHYSKYSEALQASSWKCTLIFYLVFGKTS